MGGVFNAIFGGNLCGAKAGGGCVVGVVMMKIHCYKNKNQPFHRLDLMTSNFVICNSCARVRSISIKLNDFAIGQQLINFIKKAKFQFYVVKPFGVVFFRAPMVNFSLTIKS